ncbi:centaurin-gamma-1A isoform X2 [Bemisia tabaci]|uniref:centaurin-gamma-1A isoform X2 n=1 Tax=Bemisia tabaci TaxID=7038 RepID=UPI0008F9852B|nr:PREDICTED: centaurin-gamma-1A isoform X2 [Bemisia tabaci]
MIATKWAVPEPKCPAKVESSIRLRMPESFLRSLKRRSLRVKRSKSAVVNEKRKSDSFVNSQEWTLSRGVPDLRLGIVGSLASGKSALVHRYLTGSYLQEESPEGGRFKKEILVDGQSHLLLIRDEGGPPELQFTTWVDAVIFVFSLENEASFNAVYNYFMKMTQFRNSAEIPFILVGTQDAISENNPRVIDDSRARKLAGDLKRCSYYETCATYGLNVERVFQDACHKIVQQRLSASTTCLATPCDSRPTTPLLNSFPICTNPIPSRSFYPSSPTTNNIASTSPGSPAHHSHTLSYKDSMSGMSRHLSHALSLSTHQLNKQTDLSICLDSNASLNEITPNNLGLPLTANNKDVPVTPTTSRKTRRRSNLFTPSSKKGDDKLKNGGELGSGRVIPLKQGYLYKKSSKTLNKEWKKKYVTLCDDGRLTYHPSLHDYMEEVHGKEISLQYVTVKVPGQKPRGSKTITNSSITKGTKPSNSDSSDVQPITNYQTKDKKCSDKVLLTGYELIKEPGVKNEDEKVMILTNSSLGIQNGDSKTETPNVKKRHRRIKSSGVKNQECEDSDGYEFLIVSLDNKQWQFEASSSEERDEWVAAIEQQILNSLQGNESSKTKSRVVSAMEAATLQSLRTCVAGNTHCADCDSPNPDWASLNLGVLVCIECSGIHRNLGSHISRVRSLDLDEWPQSHLSVMLALGNSLANSVWEANVSKGQGKPTPSSSREEKERWIRAKYEAKEFLTPLPLNTSISQQLIDAVCRSDMKLLTQLLAHATPEHVNTSVNQRDLRTPLHLACAMGNLPVVQLLLWYSANVKAVDHDGRTCLTYARNASRLHGNNDPANIAKMKALIDLLISNGSVESIAPPIPDPLMPLNLPLPPSTPTITVSTLPRKSTSILPLDKLPSSVI